MSLLLRADESEETARILREIPHPLSLSHVHQLQIENGLLRSILSSKTEETKPAQDALLLWREYLHEQIFAFEPFNLDSAFQQAAAWNADFQLQPPRWGLLLHPAIALERNATFLSFNPALRKCAKQSGLSLLPERL